MTFIHIRVVYMCMRKGEKGQKKEEGGRERESVEEGGRSGKRIYIK